MHLSYERVFLKCTKYLVKVNNISLQPDKFSNNGVWLLKATRSILGKAVKEVTKTELKLKVCTTEQNYYTASCSTI